MTFATKNTKGMDELQTANLYLIHCIVIFITIMIIAEVRRLIFQTNIDKHWIKTQNQGLNSEYRFWSIELS